MKAPLFEYLAPHTLEEALAHLSNGENSRVLAGGQSLMAMLNMRFAFPDCLVDINRIAELSYIRDGGERIEIGALTRQRHVEFSELIAARIPVFKEAILNVGHRQTRNRGTVGGSLCQLDPSAEIPTIALAMDADIHVASVRGQRTIPMKDFPAGYMAPAIESDEMLVGMSMEPWPKQHGHAFLEFARRHGDFAIVSVAVMLLFGADGLLERVSITLGGVASAPVRMSRAEQSLLKTRMSPEDIAAAAAICAQIDATSDTYTPSWYRQKLAGVLTQRALNIALERAER
ncbi:carbon-monoxide dehydrogenase medium subunit [Polaromonas sp. OV174]|uniref:FAD binding domain-containing protein n=1 Tax=Polaromonas sp. OV174 TaxID=1855300 RepID=UPI0008F14518|nr:FAD binding domain-containing protein [Polaromonas sp. OV174]SFB68439.1 carbon-monoxide dehydrogenase medium subunit [Polaromonas sp. OV174]